MSSQTQEEQVLALASSVSLLRAQHQRECCRKTKWSDAFEGETLEQIHSHLSIGHGERWTVCPACRSVQESHPVRLYRSWGDYAPVLPGVGPVF